MKPTQRPSVDFVTETGMNAQSPHKWWSTLKSVSCLSSLLHPLVSEGGDLFCESVGKADLLSDNFDRKQSRESVDLSLMHLPSAY